ncbi:MAG: Asp-tRNA(Asn)/Glu-tRNA(Gln) amidotransferase subunit GatC [Cellulomonadaceae bacterium]|jgi:aspartyl-tRNA(Asn)/glutamyl-tRNA(Gln) amidotransferase subunit C|nr:Asp-tRNA(Asn)/Glu-tRNA(Gln) amidotransferase subunit GatC [Cellulomonadaceae bacterium]
MSDISRDEVARLAGLARIDLTDVELDRLAGELAVIVDSVANVSAVVTPDIPYTSHPVPMVNVFRADVPEQSVNLDAVLAMAPEAADRMFVVPQILGED